MGHLIEFSAEPTRCATLQPITKNRIINRSYGVQIKSKYRYEQGADHRGQRLKGRTGEGTGNDGKTFSVQGTDTDKGLFRRNQSHQVGGREDG